MGKCAAWGAAIIGGVLFICSTSAASSDGDLVLAIALHLLLGLVLTAVIFAAGSAITLLTDRGNPPLDDLLLRAYLPGTLFVGAAAAVAVFVPFGAWLSIPMIIGSLLPLRRYRPPEAIAMRAKTVIAIVLPGCLLLASLMAFTFHGPTATLAGAPLGDAAVYIHQAISLSHYFLPLRDLGVEGGKLPGFGNMFLLLLAALLPLKWFDPFLFMSASLVVMTVLSVGLMLAMLDSAWSADRSSLRGTPLWVVAGLVTLAPRYPSWIVESPPLAFALPIVISITYLWRSAGNDAGKLGKALGAGIIGSAVSKVVMFSVLAPLVLPDLVRTVASRITRRIAAAGAITLAVLAIYPAVLLKTYLPLFLPLIDPAQYINNVLIMVIIVGRAFAAILHGIAASQMGLPGLIFAAWVGVALYVVFPFLFHATLTCVMLVTALAVIERPARLARSRYALFAAMLILLPISWLWEPGLLTIAAAWGLTVPFVVVAALVTPGVPYLAASPRRWQRNTTVGLVFALAFIVPTIVRGILPPRIVPLIRPNPLYVLTPEMRDIWLAVRDRTPSNSLIFTDQTGNTETRLDGWNDYALLSERQFFVVSWALHDPFRYDPAQRAAALRNNSDILSGKLRPDQLHLSRKYSAYFAVISVDRPAPPDAVLVYRNARYSLYELARQKPL